MAAWLTLNAFLPQPPVTGVSVIVAARDLPVGHVLAAGDLAAARWPAGLRPQRTVRAIDVAVGQTLATAIGSGEALTTARLRGPGLLSDAPAGLVAAHVGLGDPAIAAMVAPGDHVDLIGAASGDPLARDVVVLAVDRAGGPSGPAQAADSVGIGAVWPGAGGAAGPAGVVVALSSDAAAKVATAGSADMSGSGVYLTLRRP